MICMFINDAIWWNTAAFVTYFVDWYFIYIIRGNFIKFANKYTKNCFVIYIFHGCLCGLHSDCYYIWRMMASYRLDFREMIAICMICDKCVFAWHMFISHSIPLIVSRDHYALLYNIVCLIVLFVRKINWNIAGSLKTLLHDEGHL